jgi:NAD(P)-dependent dehydrogenase (short-subunit alcohol dehydrogenase family)
MASLAGKRILVTGGAGGIGNAAIRLCVAEGARVACTWHGTRPQLPDGVSLHRCDLRDRSQVHAAVDAAAQALGGLDGLLHAAGLHGSTPAAEVSDADWDRLFDANGKATVWVNQAAYRHLRAQGGSILNMGSVEGVRGFAGNAVYAASRGAVMAWTRSVALEWGRDGVRVNCVAPAMATEIFRRQCEGLPPEVFAAIEADLRARIPLGGTLGEPLRDLAPVLVFLLGEGSRFMTGQTVAVDGGLMMLGS